VGCAQKDWIDRTLVTENVTGAWAGSMGAMDDLRFDLKQEGARVAGSFRTGGRSASLIGASSGALEGSVAGDVFTFKDARGMFQGEATASSEEMKGQINASRPFSLNLVASMPRRPRPAEPANELIERSAVTR